MIPEQRLSLRAPDGVAVAAGMRSPAGARAAAVVCHPHPDMGGDMHHPVVETLACRLAEAGLATIRFDFRRPGTPEQRLADLQAALDHVAPTGPVTLVGWSFGAGMALQASADARVSRVVAIAPPLRMLSSEALQASGRAHLIVPERDQFSPPDAVRGRLPDAQITVLDGADHFLSGHEDRVAAIVLDILKEE